MTNVAQGTNVTPADHLVRDRGAQGGTGALLGDKRQLTASRGSICQDCRQTGRSLRAIVPKAKPVVSIKKIVTVVMIQ